MFLQGVSKESIGNIYKWLLSQLLHKYKNRCGSRGQNGATSIAVLPVVIDGRARLTYACRIGRQKKGDQQFTSSVCFVSLLFSTILVISTSECIIVPI